MFTTSEGLNSTPGEVRYDHCQSKLVLSALFVRLVYCGCRQGLNPENWSPSRRAARELRLKHLFPLVVHDFLQFRCS